MKKNNLFLLLFLFIGLVTKAQTGIYDLNVEATMSRVDILVSSATTTQSYQVYVNEIAPSTYSVNVFDISSHYRYDMFNDNPRNSNPTLTDYPTYDNLLITNYSNNWNVYDVYTIPNGGE